MNTTHAASTQTILAIDLGKYKSVACIHDEAGAERPWALAPSEQELLTKSTTGA